MIPFSMMKEANPPQVKGTAAGVMNFLVFLTTGVMSPFISHLMVPTSGRALTLHEFQNAFLPLVAGIAIAIVLSFIIRETGARRTDAAELEKTVPLASRTATLARRSANALILALSLGTVLVALDSVQTASAQNLNAARERNLRECNLAEKRAAPDPDEGLKTGARGFRFKSCMMERGDIE
jgi:hypothetical protein